MSYQESQAARPTAETASNILLENARQNNKRLQNIRDAMNSFSTRLHGAYPQEKPSGIRDTPPTPLGTNFHQRMEQCTNEATLILSELDEIVSRIEKFV